MCDVIKKERKKEGRKRKISVRVSTCVVWCAVGRGQGGAGGAGRIKFFTIRFGSTSLLNNTTFKYTRNFVQLLFPTKRLSMIT